MFKNKAKLIITSIVEINPINSKRILEYYWNKK